MVETMVPEIEMLTLTSDSSVLFPETGLTVNGNDGVTPVIGEGERPYELPLLSVTVMSTGVASGAAEKIKSSDDGFGVLANAGGMVPRLGLITIISAITQIIDRTGNLFIFHQSLRF